MRVCRPVFAFALIMSGVPAFGAPEDLQQGHDAAVASTGQPQMPAAADWSGLRHAQKGRRATAAPRRIGPLGGNDGIAWADVGQPLNIYRKHK